MAQYKVKDPEELLQCPYDAVHMVRLKRFQYHLLKCRKNYAGTDYVKCPFNACHEIPRPELRYHVANCADRALIEKDVVFGHTKNRGQGTYFRGCTDIPDHLEEWTNNSRGENWDNEISPYPVQVVDKTIFTGHYHRRDYLNASSHDKSLFLDKLRRRGIPVDEPVAPLEPDSLRLPHEPPRVLTSARMGQVRCQKALDSYQDDEYEKNLKENISLLQSLAAGRGRPRDCDVTAEPKVGQLSQE